MFDKQEIKTLILSDKETFYEFLENFYERIIQEKKIIPEWIQEAETLLILGIKSKTTLSKYRNEGNITYSKMGKIILYKRSSLIEFIESKKYEKF